VNAHEILTNWQKGKGEGIVSFLSFLWRRLHLVEDLNGVIISAASHGAESNDH